MTQVSDYSFYGIIQFGYHFLALFKCKILVVTINTRGLLFYCYSRFIFSGFYAIFDNWYLNQDERPDIAEYYQGSFSQTLLDAIDRDPDTVWDDQYYDEAYAEANAYFDESDTNFETAGEWNNRGDGLQRVLSIMALGLVFAAWASLLKEESNMRVLFALFAIIALVIGVIFYLGLPTVIA